MRRFYSFCDGRLRLLSCWSLSPSLASWSRCCCRLYKPAREASRRTRCTNQMRQLTIAMHNFHDVNDKLPPGSYGRDTTDPNWAYPAVNTPQWKPRTPLIPYLMAYIEQTAVAGAWDFTKNYSQAPNADLDHAALSGARLSVGQSG